MTVEDNSATVEGDVGAGLSERRVTSEGRCDEPRCGENPHQDVAVYVDETCDEMSVIGTPQLNEDAEGLSCNNYSDTDGALNVVKEFDEPAAVVIKHMNPADYATADMLAEAYTGALATDPMSTFGGIVTLNCGCNAGMTELIADPFKEIVIAPGYTDDVLDVLIEKKNLRVLNVGDLGECTETHTEKALAGGRLVQERDLWTPTFEDLEVVTEIGPTNEQPETTPSVWTVLKHVKSSGILFVEGTETASVGMGRISRVDAVEFITMKAKEHTEGKGAQGAIMTFDVFFPFSGGVEKAADAGIEAVIQPGGLVNDEDVITVCNERGTMMVFTGQRCLRYD